MESILWYGGIYSFPKHLTLNTIFAISKRIDTRFAFLSLSFLRYHRPNSLNFLFQDTDNKGLQDEELPKGFRRVAFVEEFYDIVRKVHEDVLAHAGCRKTYEKVSV